MSTVYNLIAGQSVERLAALSDGLFAIAMTLLVLDLRVPASGAIHSELDLWGALVALLPRFIPYFMSFLTLGIFWAGQQTQLNRCARSDRSLALIAHAVVALVVYWLNVLLLGVVLLGSWRYASRARLVKDDTTVEMASRRARDALWRVRGHASLTRRWCLTWRGL
jgi:uncharacterized membrane protein